MATRLAFLLLCLHVSRLYSGWITCGIPFEWYCDNQRGCPIGEDGKGCSSSKRSCSGEFICDIAKCMTKRWQCDGDNDCGDNSDERGCRWITCGIPIEQYCDYQIGCPMGEEGKECSSLKRSCSGEFICDNAKCITKRWQCYGDNDCRDNSDERDERGCQTCFADEFLCANISRCIPKTWRCDGDEDCHDSSDEQGCPPSTFHACSAREFKCANNRCIHRTWRCDGEVDCTDSSDEEYCRPCSPGQYACKNGECIPAPPTCDGKADCSDHSDEEKCPAKEKHCDLDTQFDCQKNGENCISLTDVCNQRDDCGQGEDEGQHVCHQTDLCVGNKIGCAHKCVFNYNGARCTCHNGFKLNPDNKTCDVEPRLIFSNRRDLQEILLESHQYREIKRGLRSAIGVDFDYVSQQIYWSDVTKKEIAMTKLSEVSNEDEISTKAFEIVVRETSTADGIAFDWIHRNLYWTDTGKKTIELITMNNRFRMTLFKVGLDKPRAIAVDPRDGQKWIYWSDWGDNSKIEKGGLDGSRRTEVITTDIIWPNGLTIDYSTDSLYWVDARQHAIYTSDLNGGQRHVVKYSKYELKHPFAITVFEDFVYWTEWEKHCIYKANKFNGSHLESVAVNLYSPEDLHIYHPLRQPNGSNPCGNNNGGCSYICLPAPCLEQKCPEITCACPDSADSGVLSKDSTRCTMPEVPVLPTTKNIPSKEEPQVITAGPQGTSNSPKDCNAGKITGIVIAIIVAISALL